MDVDLASPCYSVRMKLFFTHVFQDKTIQTSYKLVNSLFTEYAHSLRNKFSLLRHTLQQGDIFPKKYLYRFKRSCFTIAENTHTQWVKNILLSITHSQPMFQATLIHFFRRAKAQKPL